MKAVWENFSFTLIVLCTVSVFLIQTLSLGRVAGLVPTSVVLFTLLLLLIQLITEIFPELAKKSRGYNTTKLTQRTAVPQGKNNQDSLEEKPSSSASQRDTLLWILALPASVYVFGFIPAVIPYSFCYLKLRGGLSWRSSLVMAGTLCALIYLVFHHVLTIPLYRGNVWIWLGM